MDYSVRDSSILQDRNAFRVFDEQDCAVRVGIVREERTVQDGTTRYIVEVASGGRQIPVSCVFLTRFGGAFNFEEYRLRPWVSKFPSNLLPPSSADKFSLRSGDVVLVAYIEGQAREGVILGGLHHPARKEKTKAGNIEYVSMFNGLETQIRKDGSYKVTFKGSPINEALLMTPPTGSPVPEPTFNPVVAGSYFGFDKEGSYVVSDGKQFIKITKNPTSGSIVLVSGNNRIDLGGTVAQGTMGLKTDKLSIETTSTSIKASTGVKVESSTQVSIKGTQIAIGNSQFELFDGLDKLITALGGLVINSPVGTCTPFMAAPTWASDVVPLQTKIKALVSSLASADAVSPSDEGDITLGDEVGS